MLLFEQHSFPDNAWFREHMSDHARTIIVYNGVHRGHLFIRLLKVKLVGVLADVYFDVLDLFAMSWPT